MRARILSLAALALSACQGEPTPAPLEPQEPQAEPAPEPDPTAVDANAPATWPLVVDLDFTSAEQLTHFAFSDDAGWRWSEAEGALELHARCDYAPPHRSPHGIALLSAWELGAFDIEFEVRQSGREYGHRDLCFFTGFQGPASYYYTHLATTPDDHANNVFVVDEAPRVRLCEVPAEGTQWGDDGSWHTVRLERRLDPPRFSVYFDGGAEPVLETEDARFARGRVGFGSFDDTGLLRSLRIWSPDATASDAASPFAGEAGGE